MDFRQLIVDSGKRMLGEGLTVETWGNISARDPETGLVYITPSGMDYSKISVDDVAVLRPSGGMCSGARKPSVEAPLHLAVYAARKDVNCIIHTHPVSSMVFACTEEDIPPISDEAAQALGGWVRVCKYALPGSEELAKNCVDGLGDGMACLLRSHGAVCVGKSMDAAFKTAHVLEMTAEIYWRIKASHGTPIIISQENVDKMWDFANNVYGK